MIIYTEDQDTDLYEDCYPYYFNILVYINVIGINLMCDWKYRSKATKIVYLKLK
jgi:hypothetical protein